MDHIKIERDRVLEILSIGDVELPAVYLALCERAIEQVNLRVGLTLRELVRLSGVTENGVKRAIATLSERKYITLEDKGNGKSIITVDGLKIPFTTKDTDQTKLKLLETELARLAQMIETSRLKIKSGIRETCQGEERDVVTEIEGFFGRGLDPREAYWLGHAVARYGPDRVKAQFRKMKNTKDPIRYLLGALNKGAQGAGAQIKDAPAEKPTHYKEL